MRTSALERLCEDSVTVLSEMPRKQPRLFEPEGRFRGCSRMSLAQSNRSAGAMGVGLHPKHEGNI